MAYDELLCTPWKVCLGGGRAKVHGVVMMQQKPPARSRAAQHTAAEVSTVTRLIAIQTDTITPDNLFAIVEMALYHLSPDKHLRKAFRAIKGSQSLEEGADLSRNLVAQACQRRYSKLKGWQRHQGISGHD